MRPKRRIAYGLALAAAATLAAALAPGGASPARAGGYSYTQIAPVGGLILVGSPYRWQTHVLGRRRPVTEVERVDRRGGLVSRRWTLRGRWHINAPAFDGEGAGLDGDESTLVLQRYDPASRDGLRRRSHLAILDAGPHRLHGPSPVRRVSLPGDYSVAAISPGGSTLYLVHTLFFSQQRAEPRYALVPYEIRAQRLLPMAAIRDNGEVLAGTATARTQDSSGHRVFSLYVESKGRMYVLGLDTIDRSVSMAVLPQLRHYRNPFALDLHLDRTGHFLSIRRRDDGVTVARIDVRRMDWPPVGASADPVGEFSRTVGHSRQGRPIEVHEVGDLALPGRLLVFGCVHGDECGGSALEPLGVGGCPDGYQHTDVVPNLDPDGSARRSRLNGSGVDLNRNFPSGWRGGGAPGDPEYPGPHPFSEPESRLAARLIRHLRPGITIWFHQHWGAGSYVRAWGQSVPAGRRFAKLAGIGFRLMRWQPGTAPNWQNHRFPGTASFVVELPRGKLLQPLAIRLDEALGRLGEEVGEDPLVARKG
jgi:protein MpaA